MSKKIEWIKRGMTANNGLHMQEVCDQIADATTAINNSLQKPTTAPSATQLVTVDNTNTQSMLNIGDGLSVENGSLKASGGKLYYKIVMVDGVVPDYIFYFGYYSKNNTIPATASDLKADILQGQNGTLRIPLFVDYNQRNSTSLLTPIDVLVSPEKKLSFDVINSRIVSGELNSNYSTRAFEAFYAPSNMTVFEV